MLISILVVNLNKLLGGTHSFVQCKRTLRQTYNVLNYVKLYELFTGYDCDFSVISNSLVLEQSLALALVLYLALVPLAQALYTRVSW